MPQKTSMNRLPLDSPLFEHRGTKVKWPTLRKAWLTDDTVAQLREYATGKGRSIIFLDGTYETTLNRYKGFDSTERAVFFEFMCRSPDKKGAIFVYVWIGNFHNGSIIHFGFQYPQMRCWDEHAAPSDAFFEKATFTIYKRVAEILYEASEHPVDKEVAKLLATGDDIDW